MLGAERGMGDCLTHRDGSGRIAAALAALVLSAGTVVLGGCTDPVKTTTELLATADTSKAECIGRMRTPFDTIQISVVYMDCGERRMLFTAWPQTRADLRMICAFTWGPAVDHKGTGRLLCDNGRNGDMVYDRTDPKNIKTETKLDGGGRFEFILHEDEDFPNEEQFPS